MFIIFNRFSSTSSKYLTMIAHHFMLLNYMLAILSILRVVNGSQSVSMKIINQAGFPIELFWINTFESELSYVMQTDKPIRNDTSYSINSFDTHEFQVRFLNEGIGSPTNFRKGPLNDEIITVLFNPDEESLYVTQEQKHDDIRNSIREAIMNHSSNNSCASFSYDSEEFYKCLADHVSPKILSIDDSAQRFKSSWSKLSDRLRDYICNDETLETSNITNAYGAQYENFKFKVDELFSDSHAKIWKVDNFITPYECEILEKFGRPRLHRATVNDGAGGSMVSDARKAQQATYGFQNPKTEDPLWPLYNRVLAVVNSHSNYTMLPDGQESFTIIQYDKTDEYKPHCDGACEAINGRFQHKPGGRIATAVMYCKVPEKGGATIFTRANVFVRPQPYSATFFSYLGEDGYMDDGFTEHSGCPVHEGEKWITTFWMRDGVSHERPWDLFDSSGHLKSDFASNQMDDMVEEEVSAI